MDYLSKIKISGILNLTDGRYAAGIWAHWAGFCFDPSGPGYINPVKAKEIMGWLSGPIVTGEFGYTIFKQIKDIVELLGIEVIQIPCDYPDASILSLGKPLILEYRTGAEINQALLSQPPAWLVTSSDSYQELIMSGHNNIILELENIDSETVRKLLPYGIALTSRAETETGIRDYDAWNTLLEGISL